MSEQRLGEILEKAFDKYGGEYSYDLEALTKMQVDAYNNTEGNLNEFDGYNCPHCKNKGFIARVNESGCEVHRLCKCTKVRETLRKARKSGLGNILSDYTFDKYKTENKWQNDLKNIALAFCKDDEAKWFFIGGQVGCVDCDTEYFNGTEWKKISDYKNGEKVLQYNPTTQQGTLTIPYRYIKKSADTLYQISTDRKHIDMVLSADHNFAYITSKGNMNKKPFSEVMKIHEGTTQGFYGKIETAFNYSGIGINLTDNEIRLMCAVIGDGCFRKDIKLCSVNVKKERKKQRMRMLLKDIPHKEYQKSNGYSEFRFYAPRREKEFTDFWYNCNNEQLKIIVDEVFNWDGHQDGKRKSFFTTSKQNADFIQFALSGTGSRATIGIDYRKEKPCYVVVKTSFRSTVQMCSTGGKNKAVIKPIKPKDNKQYCFTVETGYLILRRNGRVFITGNCGKTHLCTAIAGHYIKAGYDTQYMLWCEESKKLKAIVNDFALYNDAINKYKEVSVLYIDDFLKTQNGEQPTKADINLAFEILNSRLMETDKITIISSEKTLTDILAYDEAVMSRIYQKTGKYKTNIEKDIKKNYRLRG